MTALERVKTAVKTVVATPPAWRLTQRARKPGCVVLLYHRIGQAGDLFPNLDVADFRAQIECLVRNCDVIRPEDLRERASCDVGSGRAPVLITFDDGYRSYYDLAYPILHEHRIRAVNFLCTRYVDEPTLIGWWDKLLLAVQKTTRARVEVPWLRTPVDLDDRGHNELLRSAKDVIKQQPDDQSESLTRSILEALDVDEASLEAPRQTMTW